MNALWCYLSIYGRAFDACEHVQGQAVAVDKTKEINQRLLMEVRRRLQAAKSQLHSAAPSEVDVGSPDDSPMGGRPSVLQNRTPAGDPPHPTPVKDPRGALHGLFKRKETRSCWRCHRMQHLCSD